MLEVMLIEKLVEARTMWTTPPYYTNDAQDIIKEAVSMAVDSKWETEVNRILDPENKPGTYEQLRDSFLKNNPGVTLDNIIGVLVDGKHHEAYWRFHNTCEQSDKAENDRIVSTMDFIIQCINNEIGDKIHRRNLQIADLKKKLDAAESKQMISNHLNTKDLIAIRSALIPHTNKSATKPGYGVEIVDDHDSSYFMALNHLNQMYPLKQSAEDAEVTQHGRDVLSAIGGNVLCECGHLKQSHNEQGCCQLCCCKLFNPQKTKHWSRCTCGHKHDDHYHYSTEDYGICDIVGCGCTKYDGTWSCEMEPDAKPAKFPYPNIVIGKQEAELLRSVVNGHVKSLDGSKHHNIVVVNTLLTFISKLDEVYPPAK